MPEKLVDVLAGDGLSGPSVGFQHTRSARHDEERRDRHHQDHHGCN
jgi:hypothetical protein